MKETSLIVIGSINTDIVATGIKHFPKPGEHVFGKELVIGPGGKSRNIAAMAASLMPKDRVSIISRTCEDRFGLWKLPIEACQKAGVNTDFVKIVTLKNAEKLPAIALIPVDKNGNNQIIVLPGISNDFSTDDIDDAEELFQDVSANKGMLAMTLECPIPTAIHAAKKAVSKGIKVVLDPGGIEPETNLEELLAVGLYLIKPNEHEAKILTGVEVTNIETAKLAANKLLAKGIVNVLITVGAKGAYAFNKSFQKEFSIPSVPNNGVKDETGCGDQTMAALCALLDEGKNIDEAFDLAILAGTLQFHKSGIQPITKKELQNAIKSRQSNH